MADYEVTHTYKNGIPLVFWCTLKFGDEEHSFDIRRFAKHHSLEINENQWFDIEDKARLVYTCMILDHFPEEDVVRWIIDDSVPV